MEMVWWYNESIRFNPPTALLFFHIPKCAGGSVVYWMLRRNPRFSLKLDYMRSRLFLSMHADLLGEAHSHEWPIGLSPPHWSASSVAVEFHSYTIAS